MQRTYGKNNLRLYVSYVKLVDEMQREYLLRLIVNDRALNRVVIDSHYEIRHSDTMNDPWYLDRKPYRIVWCLHPDENYLGVINVFRRPDGKIPD